MIFIKYVLKRFFKVAARNDKAFFELLFWKNVGAVREMTEGYTQEGSVSRAAQLTTHSSLLSRIYLAGESPQDFTSNIFEFVLLRLWTQSGTVN